MSRIKFRGLLLLLLLALLLTANDTMQAQAQDGDASASANDVETVFRAAYDALNAGDIEANMAYYAHDAVSIGLPPPPDSTGVEAGYNAIRAIAEGLISRNIHVEITGFQALGESAAVTALVTEDIFTELGVAPIELSGATTVQNGKIIMESWTMREESFARFMSAVAAAESKALVQRLYDEVYSGATAAVLAELVAPDALEAYQASVDEMQATFPELAVTVDHLLVEGDQVVAVLTFTGTPQDGETTTWSQVDVHRLTDGLLAEVRRFGGPSTGK